VLPLSELAAERYLDDPAMLAAAQDDPVNFVRHDGLLLIDEIQRAPELLLPIKREVGSVVGIEVKAAETVRGDDFRGLRLLAARLGDKFRAGYVLYTGEHPLSFGDRLTALPMSALWLTDAP
jgi:predicted AAA+ superfamily ATPase